MRPDGRIARHLFEHADEEGHHVHLSYEVEHADDSRLHSLDDIEDIMGINLVRQGHNGQVSGLRLTSQ